MLGVSVGSGVSGGDGVMVGVCVGVVRDTRVGMITSSPLDCSHAAIAKMRDTNRIERMKALVDVTVGNLIHEYRDFHSNLF